MENEKINIRNMYIELLNKLKGVEGVDIHYIDQMVQLLEHDIDLIEIPVNWILSVIPSGTTTEDPLVKSSQLPAAQVNSDWNASSGVAQILNKPTIPAAQVNSDWNAISGVAKILNKPSEQVKYDATIPSGGWGFDVVTGYYTLEINPGHNIDATKNAFIGLIPSSNNLTPTASESAAYNQVVSFEYGNGQFLGYLKLYSKGRPDDFTCRFVYYKIAT